MISASLRRAGHTIPSAWLYMIMSLISDGWPATERRCGENRGIACPLVKPSDIDDLLGVDPHTTERSAMR